MSVQHTEFWRHRCSPQRESTLSTASSTAIGMDAVGQSGQLLYQQGRNHEQHDVPNRQASV